MIWTSRPTASAAAKTNSPQELLARRFEAAGLQLAGSNQVIQLFRDPRRQQDGVVFIDARNDEHYLAGHIRNEAARKNRSVRVQWIDYEEDDNTRAGAIRQLEPLMKIGRVLFSTAITRRRDEACRSGR